MLIAPLLVSLFVAQSTPTPEVLAERRILVVHAETGEPIPGAEVFGVEEVSAPTWGNLWWRRREVTDEAGQVTLPRSVEGSRYGWLFARAEGFGARAAGDSEWFSTAGIDEFRFELMPESPVLIELLDFTGAPIPLAHLGIAMGCGHTPDLLQTTTGPDGRALLKGFHEYDGGISDLFIVHPEVGRSTYGSIPLEDAVDGVVRVYAPSYGWLLRGQLLQPDLTPAVGYAVGRRSNHRGPWAITDASGRFQLYGWDPDEGNVSVFDPEGELTAGFDGGRVGVERILVLEGETSTYEAKEAVELEISLLGEGFEQLRAEDRFVPFEVWDPITGQSFRGAASRADELDQGELHGKVSVPAGEYLVEVGRLDTPYAPMGLGRVRVEASETKTIKVEVGMPRLVTLEVPDYTPEYQVFAHRRGSGMSFEPGQEGVSLLEGGSLQIERFAVPYGRLGFSLERVEDGMFQRVDLELEPTTRGSDRWRLRRLRR